MDKTYFPTRFSCADSVPPRTRRRNPQSCFPGVTCSREPEVARFVRNWPECSRFSCNNFKTQFLTDLPFFHCIIQQRHRFINSPSITLQEVTSRHFSVITFSIILEQQNKNLYWQENAKVFY